MMHAEVDENDVDGGDNDEEDTNRQKKKTKVNMLVYFSFERLFQRDMGQIVRIGGELGEFERWF